MTKKPSIVECDVCIIGAGIAGLTLTAACAQLGLNTVLVEKNIRQDPDRASLMVMGGTHLNHGCLPAKALGAAAIQAQQLRRSALFGIQPVETVVQMEAVQAHMRAVVWKVAPNHSTARFEALGAYIVEGSAKFDTENEIIVEKQGHSAQHIKARKFVIATGGRSYVPPIRGLEEIGYYTEETLMGLGEKPAHILVLGGGARAIETAQSFRRLGSAVTMIDRKNLLPDQDPELVDILRHHLVTEGINLIEGAQVTEFTMSEQAQGARSLIRMSYNIDGRPYSVDGSHIFVACGRTKNTDMLALVKAGIGIDDKGGIIVNDRLQTANRNIYALGDCTALKGWHGTTQEATFQASIIIKNLLFKLPAKISRKRAKQMIGYAVFSDPEFVQVGYTEQQAREKFGKDVAFARWSLAENDRAQAEHAGNGLIKIVMRKNGLVLGVGIIAPNASEMASMWSLAIAKKVNISQIAELPFIYPSYSEMGKRAAGGFFLRKFLSPLTKKIVRFLFRLG